jgi:PAS domain S-box-containing protein
MNKRLVFYVLPIVMLLIVVVAGWFATDYLVDKTRQEIIGEGHASLLTLSIYVSSTFTSIEGAVKSLTGSPWIATALMSKMDRDIEYANSALDRYNSSVNASVTYLMDADGITVASSNRNDPDSFVGKSYRFRPYFQEAAKGQPSRYFALGITSGKRGFYASCPVQNHLGEVTGVVTMKKDIDEIESFFSKNPFCFLVSPDGIVFLSGTPSMVKKSLWPLDKTVREKLITSWQFGNELSEAVFKQTIADGMEVTLEGKDYFVFRKVIDSDGWSIVLLAPTDHTMHDRLIGILATISVCFLIMILSGIIYVTDRSRQAILQSEESKRLLLHAAGNGIFGVDAMGHVTFINPAALHMLGFAEDEMLGQSVHERIHHSHADGAIYPEEVCPMYASYTQAADKHVTDEVLWRKDGGSFPVEYSSMSIIQDGRVMGAVVNFTDITERKQAEKAMRESEARFKALHNASFGGIAIHDEGIILDCNQGLSEMTGYPVTELIGMNGLLLISDKSRTAVMNNILSGYEKPYEAVGLRKNGEEFPMRLEARNVPYKGKTVRTVEFRNIIEQKQAEKALRESEEKYRVLFDTFPLGITVSDPSGKIVESNATAAKLLGVQRDEHEARHVDGEEWRIIRPDGTLMPVDEYASVRALKENRRVENVEMGIVKTDAEITWISVTAAPLLLEKYGVVVTYGDISARKRAEQDYQTLFREMLDGFALHEIICDPKGCPVDYRFIAVNPAFEHMTGLKAASIVGRTVMEVMPETEPYWIETYGKVALTGEPAFFESYSSELKKHFEVTAFQPAANQFACIFADITDRQKAKEEKAKLDAQLQQAQKMESIGSLASGIAHDLNNILFPISGLSEMLLDDISPDTPEHKSIEQIHKSAKRGSDLVKQILAFSRQSNPQKLPIRIQPILEEALKLVQATIPRNIEVKSHINTDCGMIFGDPTQIHQIAMNLITNAFHAVEQTSGTIDISVKETAIVSFAEKEDLSFHAIPGDIMACRYACITVSDTGTGIDKTLIDKIFDPYFTTKELGKGTGLGLSVVHGIVKEHGGDIRVCSEAGKGTTFNIYLPLLEGARDSKTAAVIKQYPTGCERILLVDDEEPIVLMVQMMLEKLGYHITVRTSSQDALATFKANTASFDLVISDRGMPNMTGDQLAGELISIRPGIPIILCTGFSNENDVKRAKAMGVKGFLMKPVTIGNLAEMVRKVLDEETTVKTGIQ